MPSKARNATVSPPILYATECYYGKFPLDVWILLAEGEKFVKLSGSVTHVIEFVARLVNQNGTVEMNELHHNLHRTTALRRKILGGNLFTHPGVLTKPHEFLNTHLVVHGNRINTGVLAVRDKRLTEHALERLLVLDPVQENKDNPSAV